MPRRSDLKAAEPALEVDYHEQIRVLEEKYNRYEAFLEGQVGKGKATQPWDEPWDPMFNLYYLSRRAEKGNDRVQASRLLLEYLKPKIKAQEIAKPVEDNRIEIIVRR